MFDKFLNHWFEQFREDRFQRGCSDRDAGKLPKLNDSTYLRGYFSDRPEGLDAVVQFFPTIEDYLLWKYRSHHPQ